MKGFLIGEFYSFPMGNAEPAILTFISSFLRKIFPDVGPREIFLRSVSAGIEHAGIRTFLYTNSSWSSNLRARILGRSTQVRIGPHNVCSKDWSSGMFSWRVDQQDIKINATFKMVMDRNCYTTENIHLISSVLGRFL